MAHRHPYLTVALAAAQESRDAHHTLRHTTPCDCPGDDTLEAILNDVLLHIAEDLEWGEVS
ncbi:hypothetical protein RN607_00620 [Demequina capsici]|uniref:Uncharacterized protein n=1 Tax=Demequina capsici TaxID=3075620 RepID=A0AA96FFC3_9MICO|nr:hypothetical protein [Demequina sp. PMTSA13]WNM27536.1 hypothetical protein RN607_00620 [Demequina sp. PMTSA13]